MKYLTFLFLMLLTACSKQPHQQPNQQANPDSEKLENLLSGGQIDRIELIVPFRRTNVLTGTAVQQYVLSLRDTNRMAEPDVTKAQIATEVALMRGTNELAWLSQFDNGLWKYGQYSFRLRSSP